MNETTDNKSKPLAVATDGKPEIAFRPGSTLEANYRAIGQARELLDRYEPEAGRGADLSSPTQGQARQMLACIRGLLQTLEGPKVESQPVNMLTR